jgi:diacylglycerol diphosphate phosphatase/phosphatidate phosphatase
MPHNGLGNESTPILQRVGLAGAAARFAQRSYAADYIALGFLVAGWVLVSRITSWFI